jgi:predicted unusual protein kinase regulating ubiquinone biosynthesis (AarF/ABC1/UbiB family)
LTENNVFRFPSTFTFIFRAFASVEGIGKGLDKEYDIGKLAQPFIEKFTDGQKYQSKAEKKLDIFGKATGLNLPDIEKAFTSPRKIAYIEETLRAMEDGTLKIRTRSLENEKALERMEMTQSRMENILLASVFLNVAGLASRALISYGGFAGAAFFALQAGLSNTKIKKFDKTQAKFVQTKFDEDE